MALIELGKKGAGDRRGFRTRGNLEFHLGPTKFEVHVRQSHKSGEGVAGDSSVQNYPRMKGPPSEKVW